MRIGELARLAGLPPETIRYYERVGVLGAPARDGNGYRVYGDAALGELRYVRNARRLGLSLGDVRAIHAASLQGTSPCRSVREAVAARLAEVEGRLAQLGRVRDALHAALARLDQGPPTSARCRCEVIVAGG